MQGLGGEPVFPAPEFSQNIELAAVYKCFGFRVLRATNKCFGFRAAKEFDWNFSTRGVYKNLTVPVSIIP